MKKFYVLCHGSPGKQSEMDLRPHVLGENLPQLSSLQWRWTLQLPPWRAFPCPFHIGVKVVVMLWSPNPAGRQDREGVHLYYSICKDERFARAWEWASPNRKLRALGATSLRALFIFMTTYAIKQWGLLLSPPSQTRQLEPREGKEQRAIILVARATCISCCFVLTIHRKRGMFKCSLLTVQR